MSPNISRLDLRIEEAPLASLRPSSHNARCHSRAQVRQIARSIEAFGFLNPVLVGDGGEVIAGHGCMEAVKLLGLTAAPKIWIGHLNDTERRALLLADNQIALNTSSAPGALQIEFGGLIELGADVQTWPFQVGCRREKSRPHVDT